MSTISDISAPDIPPLSPGSSVSTRLQDEYDELLKFAVVVPKYDPSHLPHTLTDARESFLQRASGQRSHNSSQRSEFSQRSQDLGQRSQEISQRSNNTRDNELSDREEDALSEATDVTPINMDPSPRLGLPDFGGHSPIRTNQGGRPHDPVPSHYFSSRLLRQVVDAEAETERQELSQIESRDYEKVYTATVDPDVAKMETMMDQWCLDLKRNVLAEFSQSKIQIVQQGRQQLIKEQEKHASEKMKQLEEINNLKELLATYEKSIERKDQVISNLTNAMAKQRDKMAMTKKFCDWKLKHNDYKREAFTSQLAKKHHERCLSRRVWDAWHSIIEVKWRQRVEKACQGKAQELCQQLTNDYEAKLADKNEGLAELRSEVGQMHTERERQEEMMKKAFMRGVCALNLEAMTIFQNGEEKENHGDLANTDRQQDDLSDNFKHSLPEKDYSTSKAIPSDRVTMGTVQRHDRVVTSEGSRHSSVTQQSKPLNTKSRPVPTSKSLSAKVTSRVDSGKGRQSQGAGLGGQVAPPMSSVIVERHQPVNKQTMGHAVAGKYPSQGRQPASRPQSGAVTQRKLAGQGGVTMTTNIQTVKHVE